MTITGGGMSAMTQPAKSESRPYGSGVADPYSFAQWDPRGLVGAITRQQWSDFERTVLPVKDQLQSMTTYGDNKGVVDALKSQARENAKNAYGSTVADMQNSAQSYGMSLSNPGALERSAKLGMAASTVDGVNRANEYQSDLNRQVMAGSAMASGGRSYNAG